MHAAALKANGLTHLERGTQQLGALCAAAGLGGKQAEILQLFRELTTPWSGELIRSRPLWPSDVCDDHTPYEFSVVFGSKPELRILVEAQADTPSIEKYWTAGKQLSERIAKKYPISLDRFRRIEDLFAPGSASRFALWHAVSFWPDRDPEFKLYLDAQARGKGESAAVLEEALQRLGLANGWRQVIAGTRRGLELDEFKYLSLDLAPHAHSRVKVYARHHGATLEDIERVMQAEGGLAPGEASQFISSMTEASGPFFARPLFTCTALVATDAAPNVRRTLYVPVSAYVDDDATARRRIHGYLESQRLPSARYEECVAALATSVPRTADIPSGTHSYVALRRESNEPRVTVYLSPLAYSERTPSFASEPVTGVEQRGSGPIRVGFPPPISGQEPAEEIVRRYEHDITLKDHPFFRRLGREPVNLSHLWLVLANFWEAIVKEFPSRLSRVVAKLEDDAARCLIVKQLNDEMGEGDFSRAHKALYRKMVQALEPYRMQGDEAELLAPGREFGRRLGEHLFSPGDHETIGAMMMIEIYGSQTDTRLGMEFRRQQLLDPTALTWLNLHETLEVDHAGDSLKLARLLPTEGPGLAAAWRGASGVVAASQAYFDGLYALCFR